MISVIIPVFNGDPYLDKCIQSVLANTYKDLQVICVNDGSTDNSFNILKKWEEQDPRLIVISHENRGLPEARNSGLEVATGEYTAFIDSDDWVHPQYFRFLLDCMEKTDADMVVCGVREFEDNEDIETELIPELHFKKLTAKEFYRNRYSRCMIWGKLLRKEAIIKLRFPAEVDSNQDALYNLRLIASLKQPNIYRIDTPLYYYLQRPNALHCKRTYEERLQIGDWYVKNGRGLCKRKNGGWGCLLLFHVTATMLSCRYEAYLQDNRELVRRTNALLRVMMADLIRTGSVSVKDKAVRSVMILFPGLYRCFRRINGTAIKD